MASASRRVKLIVAGGCSASGERTTTSRRPEPCATTATIGPATVSTSYSSPACGSRRWRPFARAFAPPGLYPGWVEMPSGFDKDESGFILLRCSVRARWSGR
jgi:hypothetical protein